MIPLVYNYNTQDDVVDAWKLAVVDAWMDLAID